MEIDYEIQQAFKSAKNYPDLVRKLIETGVQSYTVDTASGNILYRVSEGKHVLHYGNSPTREIAPAFDEEMTIKAIRDNQQGKTDYPGFMHDIARAGIRFYEATLTGPNKRVTYIGSKGYYEEQIPI